MKTKTLLMNAPPYEVEQTLIGLGKNLRTARLRRNLTIEQVAEKIGTGERAVMAAEKGKIGTAAGVYMALLWTYGLIGQMSEVAYPSSDSEGLALDSIRERKRARSGKGLDNDF